MHVHQYFCLTLVIHPTAAASPKNQPCCDPCRQNNTSMGLGLILQVLWCGQSAYAPEKIRDKKLETFHS